MIMHTLLFFLLPHLVSTSIRFKRQTSGWTSDGKECLQGIFEMYKQSSWKAHYLSSVKYDANMFGGIVNLVSGNFGIVHKYILPGHISIDSWQCNKLSARICFKNFRDTFTLGVRCFKERVNKTATKQIDDCNQGNSIKGNCVGDSDNEMTTEKENVAIMFAAYSTIAGTLIMFAVVFHVLGFKFCKTRSNIAGQDNQVNHTNERTVAAASNIYVISTEMKRCFTDRASVEREAIYSVGDYFALGHVHPIENST